MSRCRHFCTAGQTMISGGLHRTYAFGLQLCLMCGHVGNARICNITQHQSLAAESHKVNAVVANKKSHKDLHKAWMLYKHVFCMRQACLPDFPMAAQLCCGMDERRHTRLNS